MSISEESTFITPPLKPMKHQYPFLDKHDKISCILCSSDGLLLVSTCRTVAGSKNNIITLWNPTTREICELPKSGYDTLNHSLGYDSSTDDYKVIEEAYTYHGYSYQVFSLRSNSWRKIKSDNLRLMECFYINLKGPMHWLKPDLMRKNIVCFTLSEETFIKMEIELPDDFDTSCSIRVNLCVLQGCLCLSRMKCEGASLNVWLMKEYGVKAAWTKFITIPHLPINYPCLSYSLATPFCSMHKAVYIIHQYHDNSAMVVYDLEKKDHHVVEIIRRQIEFHFRTELTFVESLVSLLDM